ncbi:MAG: hypothetical protein ABIR63_03375 [Sphingomicrobium sp.]
MKQMDKADFTLKLHPRTGDWWMAKGPGPAHGPGHYPSVSVDYDHGGEFTFKIAKTSGITFATDKPFTAKSGQASPGDFDAQFGVVGAGTGTLVVTDANADQSGGKYVGADYPYELHFSNGKTLDPIIRNGGCCQPTDQSALIYYAVGVIALLALLALFIRPMLARRSANSVDSTMKDRDQL